MLLHNSSIILGMYDDTARLVKFERKHRLAKIVIDL